MNFAKLLRTRFWRISVNYCFWLQAGEPCRSLTAEICYFYLVLFTLTSLYAVLFSSFIYYFFMHICFETKYANAKLYGELRPFLIYNLKERDWIFRLLQQIWSCEIFRLKFSTYWVILTMKKTGYNNRNRKSELR